ncbi:MAG TPA: prepilin peptidase [Vicinamibacterales bacterium]|jgi:prepilin peptidase CpaA
MDVNHLVCVGLALVACVCDLRTRRIPQVLTLGGAAAAIVYHTVTGGWMAGATSLGGWSVGILIFLVPFALGGLGAGDVKLLGALGAWLGPADAVWLGIYTGVAGGVIALLWSVLNGYLRQALRNVYLLLMFWRVSGVRPLPELTLEQGRGPRLAYAVPILAGMMVTLWLR